MQKQSVRFVATDKNAFFLTAKKRVDQYFKNKGISRYANTNMVFKTIFMLALYFVPFIFLLVSTALNPWLVLLLWIVMGFGMAGIGLSIMHDANHGAYSKNKHVNKWLGHLISLVGGHAINWKIQHNVLHHSFTNIDGHDDDVDVGNLMRFTPNQKPAKMHRLQHFYAWFLYGFLTLSWVTLKDFKQLERYRNQDLLKSQKTTYAKEMVRLIVSRVLYYGYVIALPILLTDISWWLVVLGALAMHFTAGLILSCIFQPAHVMDTSEYPVPDENNKIHKSWAAHQMFTTTNFAPKSWLFSWYVGGLNFQIEHHLFPNICHVHYKKLSEIIRETAEEFNLPYNVQPTFAKALWVHGKHLKKLGRTPYITD